MKLVTFGCSMYSILSLSISVGKLARRYLYLLVFLCREISCRYKYLYVFLKQVYDCLIKCVYVKLDLTP